MRILYIILLSFVCMFSFSSYSSFHGGDDDDNNKSYKKDDDDKGKGDDDDNGNSGGYGNSNNNYLEVNANRNLYFKCSSPSDLEQPQILNNAIGLKFKTKNSNCSIYAKVSNYSVPRRGNANDIPLQLAWNSDNSPNAYNLIKQPITLTKFDQRLFVQPKKSQTFHFSYDLRLKELGYDYPAGRYNFTILFTMTQP